MFVSGTDTFWQTVALGYVVNHGCLAFPERVAVCLLFPLCGAMGIGLSSFPLFLWCTINNLLKLHASNAFLFNKYARDSNLADCF